MVIRSLQYRIATFFAGLLVLVMAVVLVLIAHNDERIVAEEMARELGVGATIFGRLVEQNRNQLETASALLAADFGFREAIATHDRPTIRSALRNHGARISAQVMMAITPDGEIIAETQQTGSDPRTFPFPDLLAQAQQSGRSVGFVPMADGRLYQMVLAPVLAPKLIAWVAMGFPVSDQWAHNMATTTGLMISVVRNDTRGLLATSFPEALREALRESLGAAPKGQQEQVLTVAGDRYQTQLLPLGNVATVVLQRSLSQAEAPFRSMQLTLLTILLAGVAVFISGGVMFARHIAGPANQLAFAARRIEEGDYSQPLPDLPPDELGQLARSFAHMREGIAAREHKILKLAYEDTLTGLPNRVYFLDAFTAIGADQTAAVAVLDLDRFALINNALGHPVGDRLLGEVAARLRDVAQPPVLAARLWGDEFAFLLRGADEVTASIFAERLLHSLHSPIPLDDQYIDVEGSLGIALYPRDGNDATTLLRRAELAMSVAKRKHTGYAFAGEVSAEPAHEQLSLIGEMRNALAHNEFIVHYQPKLALRSGRITGAEALLRWQHPRRGLVPPLHFIPFAEQTGFIREITPWLLEQVIRQTARWRNADLDIVPSINLSTHDLLNPDLVGDVRRLLADNRLPADGICLEITESALMEDPTLALHHLSELAALGLKLSIDDYGSGQASLAYLKTLPVHELKIDQSFIRTVTVSPKDAAIVQSTILLSHALGLTVVAEGAETPADLLWLRQCECDIAQGYGIARPMPAGDLPGWIAHYEGTRREEDTDFVAVK